MKRLAVLLALASFGGAWAQSETPRRAPAVILGIEGEVRIERADNSSPLEARVGDRLQTGDLVHADTDSAASIIFSGGHIVRVPAGSRLEIVVDPGSSHPESSVVMMSDRLLTVVEDGLWVLSDPRGDILLSPMRSGPRTRSSPHSLLSPRRETLTGPRPVFYWYSTEMEARVVVETDDKVVWRSAVLRGSTLAYPSQAPELRPGETYRWWIEASSGEPLTSPERFVVPTRELSGDFAEFESELDEFVSAADAGQTKALLRCAFYQGTGAWSALLEASFALRQPGKDTEDPFVTRAIALARTKMGLTEAEARRFVDVKSE